MPRKQAINESSAAAAPARTAKPKAPRVKSAKHTKAAAQENTTPAMETAVEPAAGINVVETVLVEEPVVVVEPVIVVAQDSAQTPDAAARKAPATIAPVSVEDAREKIAKIAYGYWEARGRVGGNPLEDWVRAENEYRQRYVA